MPLRRQAQTSARAASGESPEPGIRSRLVLLSFLMLLVELALIRWAASNVLYLAYFTNFILLASFLGIGVGFIRARAERDAFPLAPVALTALVAFVLVFPVQTASLAGGRRLVGLPGVPALPMWVELPLIFAGATLVMALIAEGTGRAFAKFEPLEAYRLDILGALGGIAAFSVLSFLNAPPLAWGVIVAALFTWLLRGRLTRAHRLALGGLVVLLGVESLFPLFTWSPYYKVTVHPPSPQGVTGLKVNGIPHQSMVPLELIRRHHTFYVLPYRMTAGNPLDNVLIVGAGTGNDVAVALAEGARRVDAVEIDPVLQRIGRDRHPDRPYADPRVRVTIDDGRAFLERTGRRYDLILFALPIP